MQFPPECLESRFVLKDGDSFRIGNEYVEVGYTEHETKPYLGEVKCWILSNENYERVITEDEVESCVVVVKKECLDSE